MKTPRNKDDLHPSTPPGRGRAVALALLVHALLLVALAWGVFWQRGGSEGVVQAELWAPPAQQEAPPEPQPTPPPAPPPPPPPPPQQVQQPPQPSEADIALEREKKRKEEEERRQAEERKREQERLAAEKKKEEERLAAERKKQEEERLAAERKKEQERLAAEKKKEEERIAAEKKKKEEQQRLAAEKKRKEEQQRLDQLAQETRNEQMRRMQQQAGNNTGSVAGSGGRGGDSDTAISSAYGGKLYDVFFPKIVFSDRSVSPDIVATVRINAAPDGTIIGRTLLRPSGNKVYDDAVLTAIDKTPKLPPDGTGRIPQSVEIDFSPGDANKFGAR